MRPSRPRRKATLVNLSTYQPELRAFFAWPWPDELDQLRTLRRSLSVDDSPATTIRTERQLLSFDTEKWGELAVCAIPRALITAAVVLLANAGVPALVLPALIQLPPLPKPVSHPIERTPIWLAPVINCIRGHWQFLLNRAPGAPSTRCIIEWIVRSFPEARIAIVSENQSECAAVHNWLRKRELDSNYLRGGGCLPIIHQRVVGTCFSGHVTQQLSQRDIVIFANARNAFSERGRMFVQHAPRARLIGIRRQDERFSPWEQDWLFALFGAARITLSSKQFQGVNAPPSISDCGRILRRFLATRPRGNNGI